MVKMSGKRGNAWGVLSLMACNIPSIEMTFLAMAPILHFAVFSSTLRVEDAIGRWDVPALEEQKEDGPLFFRPTKSVEAGDPKQITTKTSNTTHDSRYNTN